jgi:hypothetical protein
MMVGEITVFGSPVPRSQFESRDRDRTAGKISDAPGRRKPEPLRGKIWRTVYEESNIQI